MRKPTIKDILDPSASFETRFIPDIEYLEGLTRSFQQGDILIVGVDTDELTRKRKGENRPVVPENERLRMLTFLRSVDIVTLRTLPASEEDIDYLHKVLRPDVFIMSLSTKDFPVEKETEVKKYVGHVEIFKPQAETSTSARIRHLMIDGVVELEQRISKTVRNFVDEMKGGTS